MAKNYFDTAVKSIGKSLTKFGESDIGFKATQFNPKPVNFRGRVAEVEAASPEFGYAASSYKNLLASHERFLNSAKAMAEKGAITMKKGKIVS